MKKKENDKIDKNDIEKFLIMFQEFDQEYLSDMENKATFFSRGSVNASYNILDDFYTWIKNNAK